MTYHLPHQYSGHLRVTSSLLGIEPTRSDATVPLTYWSDLGASKTRRRSQSRKFTPTTSGSELLNKSHSDPGCRDQHLNFWPSVTDFPKWKEQLTAFGSTVIICHSLRWFCHSFFNITAFFSTKL